MYGHVLMIIMCNYHYLNPTKTISQHYSNSLPYNCHIFHNTFNLCLWQEDILLPHGFFIESLHLRCTNLSKFPGSGSMSITIDCILEP